MASKIRIKLGAIEVEYEGEHDFLERDLLALVKDLMEIAPLAPPSRDHKAGNNQTGQGGHGGGGTGTVSTFAAKLKVASGPDLILAALLHSAKVDGKASLKRKDLLTAMQSAKSHYKASYSNNLSSSLKNLVKSNDINDVAADEYALSTAKMTELETQVAQAC
ncbi:MAG: hypothetical protein U1A27_01625 [Phycisphaerae bacterium]